MSNESAGVQSVGMTPYSLIQMQLFTKLETINLCIVDCRTRLSHSNRAPPTHRIKSLVYSLFLQLEPMLKRSLDEGEYAKLIYRVNSDKYEQIEKAFRFMNIQLDKAKLTLLDSEREYDGARWQQENEIKGGV